MRRPSRLSLICLALFLAALALRLYRLDAQSLWLDEGGTWAEITGRTGKGWLALLGELFSPDAGYPLYHLLLKAWVALAGDSAWALRFPSALAGALAVVVLFLAARELEGPQNTGTTEPQNYRTTEPQNKAQANRGTREQAALPGNRPSSFLSESGQPSAFSLQPSAFVAVIATISPFALWHAQDAKAYSLLLLAVAALAWLLLRVLRTDARRDWLALLAIAAASLFVHRLALMVICGAVLTLALAATRRALWQRAGLASLAVLAAAAGLGGTLRAAATERAFIGRSGVGPLEGLGLTLVRFSLDRWPGDIAGYLGLPLAIWLLPASALGLYGLWLLARHAIGRRWQAIALLCMLVVPLGLLGGLLASAPIYEARYAMVAFPGWLLALGYCFAQPAAPARSMGRVVSRQSSPSLALPIATLLAAATALSCALALFQPTKGLYSGDPLKEQWREAVAEIASRAHPDDLLLIHPYYVAGMYDYYAPRLTPDPLPPAVTFPVFAAGDTCGESDPARVRQCWQRRYEPFFNQAARGRKRALLLIAPDHARTVDPPKTLAELLAEAPQGQAAPAADDRYGWVGLRFQYPQKTWPCGATGDAYIGVEVLCQSFPETYSADAGEPGQVPQPSRALSAVFGGELRLRGFSLDLRGGAARAGGALPVTLYWEAAAPPARDYRMFLHLCRDCESPPLANDDGEPLGGWPPAGKTSTWLVGDPVHDERALALPAGLPPGRYTLLLGVYSGDGAPATRLPIEGGAQLGDSRLILGEVEIQ